MFKIKFEALNLKKVLKNRKKNNYKTILWMSDERNKLHQAKQDSLNPWQYENLKFQNLGSNWEPSIYQRDTSYIYNIYTKNLEIKVRLKFKISEINGQH